MTGYQTCRYYIVIRTSVQQTTGSLQFYIAHGKLRTSVHANVLCTVLLCMALHYTANVFILLLMLDFYDLNTDICIRFFYRIFATFFWTKLSLHSSIIVKQHFSLVSITEQGLVVFPKDWKFSINVNDIYISFKMLNSFYKTLNRKYPEN